MLPEFTASPTAMLARWPVDQPMVVLHSGRLHQRWARWTIIAVPQAWYRFSAERRSEWLGDPPIEIAGRDFTHDPLADLDMVLGATRIRALASPSRRLPFAGGWIGFLSYDLGRVIEPTATHSLAAEDDRRWPLIEFAWCPQALIHDRLEDRWYSIAGMTIPSLENADTADADAFEVGALQREFTDATHQQRITRTLEYIAAGDVFQANLTARLTASFSGSTRALARAAFDVASPWYGAYLELPDDRCVVSMSPELFLDVDFNTGHVVTRPIKGTRSAGAQQRERLGASEKDRAELHMIVDLMRNDLGRVCRYGSVHVADSRSIEAHPTVSHGVAEVVGRLRDSVGPGSLLAATFPGGSVTGAPKIRAMQIIDELEPVRRNVYCGSIGYFSNCGRMGLNIAIRTIALTGRRGSSNYAQLQGRLDYGVGGGIVADSAPDAELRECHDKAAVLHAVIERQSARATEPRIEIADPNGVRRTVRHGAAIAANTPEISR